MPFFTIDMDSAIWAVSKKVWRGAPTELNYAAMIYSLVARLVERIPTIKDLIKRLKNDIIFRLECGFLISDEVPHIQLLPITNAEKEKLKDLINTSLLHAFIR
jgi:transposase